MNLNYLNILHNSAWLSILTLFSHISSSPLSNTINKENLNTINSHTSHTKCQNVDDINSKCSRYLQQFQLPNIFGHDAISTALSEMAAILDRMSYPSDDVTAFLCVLYFPPCSTHPHRQHSVDLPCRSACDTALSHVVKDGSRRSRSRDNNISSSSSSSSSNRDLDSRPWPVMCHTLPTQRCYVYDRLTGLTYVKNSPSGTAALPKREEIAKFAPIEAELGGDNEGYELEVISFSPGQDRARRYDITDLGDPELFQGWADVQGTGAANDYCRVIGKSKRRFLSCHLAGIDHPGHHYVSKLGFELGFPGTWFMRDMDADGKDDYCRCVGTPSNSRVTCMKSGEKGFFGSPMQSGSQHSFELSSTSGCHNRRVNALFGE